MEKVRRIVLAVAAVAFYIGAVCFFADGNTLAGALGMVAGTASLAALLIGVKKSK